MAEKESYKIIHSTNVESLSKQVNIALKGWYVLAWWIISFGDELCQAVVDKSLTNLVIDEVKKCTNAWAVAVSGSIRVQEW